MKSWMTPLHARGTLPGRAWLAFLAFTLVGAVAVAWIQGSSSRRAAAAPEVFASPFQGSCYLATPRTCKIKVDPFTVYLNPSDQLKAIQLQADGQTIYDYRSDLSNPPSGSYTPSLVRRDFAARCGESYVLNLLVTDSSSPAYTNAGQTATIACPEGEPYPYFLPAVLRDSPGR
jgi:hypothetical protein